MRRLILSLLLIVHAPLLTGAALREIGDTQRDPSAEFMSSQYLANLLVFSNTFLTDDRVVIVDPADVSLAFDFVTIGNLTFNSDVIELDHSLTLGTGNLILNATTIDLSATLFGDDGSLVSVLDGSRLSGTASLVNVLDDGALLQQSVFLSSALAVIGATAGTSTDLDLFGARVMDLSGGSLSGNVDVLDTAVLNILGGGFEIDTGGGFAAIGPGAVAATSGSLRGTLESGDYFEVSFSQAGPGQIVLAPEPGTGALLALGLVLITRARRRRA